MTPSPVVSSASTGKSHSCPPASKPFSIAIPTNIACFEAAVEADADARRPIGFRLDTPAITGYCNRNGNKYYENHAEFPLRHRWVDYAADNEFNASQVDPLWHSWLHHIRQLPPHEDAGIQKMTQAWMTTPRENITGTRGAFKTYNTTKPKIVSTPSTLLTLIHSQALAAPARRYNCFSLLSSQGSEKTDVTSFSLFFQITVGMGTKGRPEGIDCIITASLTRTHTHPRLLQYAHS